MNQLTKGIKRELKKLFIKKKYIIISILAALVCILRIGSSMLLEKLSQGTVVLRTNLTLEMLPFFVDALIPLIVFMAITDLFSGEVQEDTMKSSLTLPLSRFKVMLSKSLAAFFLGCLVMLFMFAICLVLQIISGSGTEQVLPSLTAYIIDMIPIFATVSLALLINLIAKSPTLSMLVCIAAYIFFKYLNWYVSPLGQIIFTAYTQWHRLFIGSLLPFSSLMPKIGILSGSILILYTLSYIIFEKKDF